MSIDLPCLQCKHFDRAGFGRGEPRCDAFPTVIPAEIQFADHDHREPFPGDQGIRFEPTDEPKRAG
jgi:hypothetical protein